MTTWRKNADRLRKRMKETLARNLRKEISPSLRQKMRQAADAVPEPEAGYVTEVRGGSTPEYAVNLLRSKGWRGVAYTDVRGLSQEFAEAYFKSDSDDMTPLAEYLKSGKSLTPEETEKLAQLLPKKTRTGRPHNRQLRAAARMARTFYKALREMNEQSGVKDHGHGDDMKLCAARVTVEDWFSYEPDGHRLSAEDIESFAQRICEVWDRAKYHSGAREGLIAFPASWVEDLPPETDR
jgi:hypothetical protein